MLSLDLASLKSFFGETGHEIAIKWFAEIVIGIVSPIPLAWRYFDTLLDYSGNPRGSRENLRYKALRYGLIANCRPLQIYTKLLKKTLDKIDVLFGDLPGRARSNFGARLFRLTEPKNVWTGASFDRCLFFALLYPILTVALTHAVYGDAGVAGAALLMGPDRSLIERWVVLGVVVSVVIGVCFAQRRVALASIAAAFIGALTIGAVGATAITAALAILVFGSSSGDTRSGVVAVTCFVTIALALTISSLPFVLGTTRISSALAGAFAGVLSLVVSKLYQHAKRHGNRPIFLTIFNLAALVLIYGLIWLLAPHVSPEAWKRSGALLLIFGVLTLLNAPFDFLSLGLTRGFLRRGLQTKGLSPIRFAFYDALAAVVVISVLICVLIVGIQLYGILEVHGHQERTIDLTKAFETIHDTPYASQNFWIYTLLITTQAPSLFNVAVGAVSVARAFRPLSEFIHYRLPTGKAVLAVDKFWMVPLLILRSVVPACAGLAAGLAVLLAVPLWMLPLVDFDIFQEVTRLVNADIPGRLLGP